MRLMTQIRTGTTGATGGSGQTTRWNASLRVRLAGFAVAVVAVAFLIIRIDTSIWRQQAQLQEEFAAVKAEKFYFAANFRVRLRQIRETWLELLSALETRLIATPSSAMPTGSGSGCKARKEPSRLRANGGGSSDWKRPTATSWPDWTA